MTFGVFFPSLMGVGILVSGALLISDWVSRLFPHSNMRRRHNVVVGTYGAINDAIEAAGYHVAEPWFLRRGLRNRLTYFALAVLSFSLATGSAAIGEELFEDQLGVFFKSPWAIGLGYGIGAALVLFALLCLIIGLGYSRLPRPLMRLVRETPLGRIVLPTDADHWEAVNNVQKET